MPKKLSTPMIVGIVVVVALLVLYFCYWHKSSSQKRSPSQAPRQLPPLPPVPQRENFTALAAGAIDNIGSLLDDSYELLPGADNDVPAVHYADLVDQGDLPKEMQPKNEVENFKPMERLERIQGKGLMPRVSTAVTPYAVDVADPAIHMFMVNAPKAQSALKSRYKDYSLSSFIRGDIPIQYFPDVPLISKTEQGVDDLRLDGLFTPHFNALYQQYTGKAFKNLPVHVAGAGQAAGYGGASSGVIMDGF
jgi:hypothetical protein